METLWATVAHIIASDLPHRRAGKPSQYSNADLAEYLISEAYEVKDQPDDRDELADVLALVVQLAQRVGCSHEELESRAIAKLELRFPDLSASRCR